MTRMVGHGSLAIVPGRSDVDVTIKFIGSRPPLRQQLYLLRTADARAEFVAGDPAGASVVDAAQMSRRQRA